ncbi:hypothetical protein [Campylobacter vulpis]|uniref:Uncharacterized protein n=1 Tax=Campylobacter vulpis TaxID=1655500 RepID=A0A2G4R5I3_9BACT|nr:hypothetical protein [Campylobacter vulpis]HEG3194330.1 hypothetical protein [Campylobacter upsaliensis]MBS4240563.1 hypothetical protein [Campylobacter vulpis]MBS4251978.1 hypothetical protein [Campylobacter vulpis]MBS4274880.1 hypothetical protein [Campylobacter vulpis]MBS4281154.1 hypothetical protein [Campylobacter vulpis]
MYEKKDLKALKIAQKAREFNDSDLLNEAFVSQLINAPLPPLNLKEKEDLMQILNALISSKEAALLSK